MRWWHMFISHSQSPLSAGLLLSTQHHLAGGGGGGLHPTHPPPALKREPCLWGGPHSG